MSRFINPIPQYIKENGDLAAAGTLTFYESGTNTLLTIYADINETTPIANPVTLGSRGEVPNIFFSASARCVLADSDGNQIYDVDPVNSDQSQGELEAWNSNIVYSQSDTAIGNDGLFYISLANDNQGNNPTLNAGSNAFWAQFILPQIWNSAVTYTPNAFAIKDGVIYRNLISDNLGNDPALDDGSQWRSIADAVYVTYDNTSSGLVAVTAQGALDEIVNLINNLPSSVVYRGQLDVSAGDSALPASPSNGDLYVIAVGGTITVSVAGGAPSATAVNPGEQIIYNGDTTNWDLIAQVTQAASVGYSNTTSGRSATNVQDALDEAFLEIDSNSAALSTATGDITNLDTRIDSLEAFEATAGTAYTSDSQASGLDTTANSLLKNPANGKGSFGIGAYTAQQDWPNTSLNDCSNAAAGIYRTIGSTTDEPAVGAWVIVFAVPNASQSRFVQLAIESDISDAPRMYVRSSNSGSVTSPTWSDWSLMLKQTDFGVGGVGVSYTGDLDDVVESGFYAALGPATNKPEGDNGMFIHSNGTSSADAFQIFVSGVDGKLYYRLKTGFSFDSWARLYTTANANSTVDYNTGALTVNPGAKIQHIEHRSAASDTITLANSSDWAEGDMVVVRKARLDGSVTIQGASLSQTFFFPDNTSDTEVSSAAGVSAQITLTRMTTATQWSVTVQG